MVKTKQYKLPSLEQVTFGLQKYLRGLLMRLEKTISSVVVQKVQYVYTRISYLQIVMEVQRGFW